MGYHGTYKRVRERCYFTLREGVETVTRNYTYFACHIQEADDMIHIHFTFKPKTDALRSLDDSIEICKLLCGGKRSYWTMVPELQSQKQINKFIYLLHHYCVIRE